MKINRVLATGAALLLAVAACGGGGGGAKPEVRIGSDNFYESVLMAEIYAQVLENDGYTVTRSFRLGSRQERAPAFTEGQVDLVPEYVGSGLGFYDATLVTGDGAINRDLLQEQVADFATVFGITPGEDTNAGVVRTDTATELGLATMSDLAAVQDQLRWGLPPDCDENPLCRGALEMYGITYPPAERESLAACDVPIAEALNGDAIDFAWLCSTQPAIAQYGFVVLSDDLDLQPADNLAPMVRNDYLETVGDAEAFEALLDAPSALMTTEELTRLGVEIAVDQREVDEVATEWLTEKGLLTAE
ncbi:MAG: glycine betaine ABC transporter substrate-binding protein [Acidimicrobiia bacterium]